MGKLYCPALKGSVSSFCKTSKDYKTCYFSPDHQQNLVDFMSYSLNFIWINLIIEINLCIARYRDKVNDQKSTDRF